MTDAATLAEALGGKRRGRQYAAKCPAHPDRDPSLIIYDGHTSVQVRCLAGCTSHEVIAALARLGLWNGSRPRAMTREERMHLRRLRREREEREVRARAEASAHALRLWDEAVPAIGTPAEFYLTWWRGVVVDESEAWRQWWRQLLTGTIRYHPRCPREHTRQPAMVALMRSVLSDKAQAIHRTFLNCDGDKDGLPMELGPAGGAAIKLMELPDAARVLFASEGIETGLCCIVRGAAPVWALGSAGAFKSFPVLAHVRKLIVASDPDRAGQRAASFAVTRWREAGHEAEAFMVDVKGADFADWFRLRARVASDG